MLGIHGTKAYLCVVKGYSRQGMSGKERLDFIFLWFCPVFVPSGICITIQAFVISLNINNLQMIEARKMH